MKIKWTFVPSPGGGGRLLPELISFDVAGWEDARSSDTYFIEGIPGVSDGPWLIRFVEENMVHLTPSRPLEGGILVRKTRPRRQDQKGPVLSKTCPLELEEKDISCGVCGSPFLEGEGMFRKDPSDRSICGGCARGVGWKIECQSEGHSLPGKCSFCGWEGPDPSHQFRADPRVLDDVERRSLEDLRNQDFTYPKILPLRGEESEIGYLKNIRQDEKGNLVGDAIVKGGVSMINLTIAAGSRDEGPEVDLTMLPLETLPEKGSVLVWACGFDPENWVHGDSPGGHSTREPCPHKSWRVALAQDITLTEPETGMASGTCPFTTESITCIEGWNHLPPEPRKDSR